MVDGRARPTFHDTLEQALTIDRSLDDPLGEASALNKLGAPQLSTGDGRESAASHRRALELARTGRIPLEEARALESLGMCALQAGDTPAGERRLRLALDIYEPAGAAERRRVRDALSGLTGTG
ncbi:tetratricopeptide repeat protein [Streptomyces sp. NPDC058683]|uniref:tetratricopeptide repeat protein n=1 Tax=Streptomyces sp. NPDC058683 TaxID=3346597 RepID=UPI00365BAB3A